MADDQPTAARNPARHEADRSSPLTPPTPDSTVSTGNVGRRAEAVNGAVVGSGAGAGGGGGPEEFDTDAQGGGAAMPNRRGEREARDEAETGDIRN